MGIHGLKPFRLSLLLLLVATSLHCARESSKKEDGTQNTGGGVVFNSTKEQVNEALDLALILMLTKKRGAQFLLIALCFLLFPMLAHAGLESSLLGIKSKLTGVILPVLSVIGIAIAAISFFTGKPPGFIKGDFASANLKDALLMDW